MNSQTQTTGSAWEGTAEFPSATQLTADITTDVCVVGGGIAGLTTAYLLARSGKKVVVVEMGSLGGGETARTTAHLSNAIDDRYAELEKMLGQEAAKLAAESHTAAIDRIEAIVRDEGIECGFERIDGYLFQAAGQKSDVLECEYEAARRNGIVEVEWVDRAPLTNFDTGRCLRFRRQAQFHPLKYLAALARAIFRDGGRIYTQTQARSVGGGRPAKVQVASGAEITANAVVVATNTPVNDMVVIHSKQAPYRSYVIAARVPAGSVARALYWDTLDAYHYVRLQHGRDAAGEYDLLIVGGEDQKTAHADDGARRFAALEAWARLRFPSMGSLEYCWSGQVMEPMDGLAFIGRNPMDEENVYVATGDSGMGMTHGTIAGMLISDLIHGRENPWTKIYDPSRQMTGNLAMYAEENLDVAKEYAKWLLPGEVRSADEIPAGHGAILRRGLHKLAVYRDDKGQLVELSGRCPHLHCIVAWNSTERVWDCPCHGSRFGPDGKLLGGPANTGLSPA